MASAFSDLADRILGAANDDLEWGERSVAQLTFTNTKGPLESMKAINRSLLEFLQKQRDDPDVHFIILVIVGFAMVVTGFLWQRKTGATKRRRKKVRKVEEADFEAIRSALQQRDRSATTDDLFNGAGSGLTTSMRSMLDSARLTDIAMNSSRIANPSGIRDAQNLPSINTPMPTRSDDGGSIWYRTYTPPMQWKDAAKNLLPQYNRPEMEFKLGMDLLKGTLSLLSSSQSSAAGAPVDIEQVNLHVKQPAVGGVLEVTVKEASPAIDIAGAAALATTMGGRMAAIPENYSLSTTAALLVEYTFCSASCAAQFQQDVLAYQVIGKQLFRMYQALELVQRGSLTSPYEEYVLHDKARVEGSTGGGGAAVRGDENTKDERENETKPLLDEREGGPAWDDIMRCLGVYMPLLRARLLEFWRIHHEMKQYKCNESSLLHPYQRGKRVLLKPVDFFRLFIPQLVPQELPETEPNKMRMEHLVLLRKEVAQAAVYVGAFVQARAVVNEGWASNEGGDAEHDTSNASFSSGLKRRMAFDSDFDNEEHDRRATNEFYEATLSRDVLCKVQSHQHFSSNRIRLPSSYQAYSLVGIQSFDLGIDDDWPTIVRLKHEEDPVRALPSLWRLISKHPNLDFFVTAFYPENLHVAVVFVFVRSLPKGVDPAFDTLLNRFREGDLELKDRKFEVHFQSGPNSAFGPVVWGAIQTVSVFLSWSRNGEPSIPYKPNDKRTGFPGMRVSTYARNNHFVGPNYMVVSTEVHQEHMASHVFSTLYRKLEDGVLGKCDIDISFVLKGEESGELPERVLGTARLVHVDLEGSSIGLDRTIVANDGAPWSPTHLGQLNAGETSFRAYLHPASMKRESSLNLVVRAAEDTIRHSWRFFAVRPSPRPGITAESGMGEVDDEYSNMEVIHESPERKKNVISLERSIMFLLDILEGVKVPFRKKALREDEVARAEELPEAVELPQESEWDRSELLHVDVLSRITSRDLKRFFLGANCKLPLAAERVVKSTAWRGLTFPVDTRHCRVELQNGQFFAQGKCRAGHPVMYFQNFLLGPWRGDEEAVINAILYRLEHYLHHYDQQVPPGAAAKITLVILTGKPEPLLDRNRSLRRQRRKGSDGESLNDVETTVTDNNTIVTTISNAEFKEDPCFMGTNPRLTKGEDYHSHTNKNVILRLLDLLSQHYPERLYKALLLPGKKHHYGYYATAVSVRVASRTFVKSDRTRTKTFVLHQRKEIINWIDEEELVTLVGGKAPIHPTAFIP